MFRIVESRDDFYKALCIRAIVFIGEQGCPYREEVDGLDEGSLHVLGEKDGEPVATGRIRVLGETAKLERLAILPDYRGKGYGNKLLRYMLEIAADRGAHRFTLHAQVVAVSFYQRHGFQVIGPVFDEAGIAHQKMILDIAIPR